MNTDFTSAIMNLVALAQGGIYKGYEYQLSYNHNEASLEQLREVLMHKLLGMKKFSLTKYLKKRLGIDFSNTFAKIKESIHSNDKDLKRHIHRYKFFLQSQVVLVVAHSQGNFYANMAYSQLKNEIENLDDKFKIISIANPDVYVGGNGPHFTHKNDLVILPIPGAMQGSSVRAPPSYSSFNHGFLEDYYNKSQLKGQIDSIIDSLIESLVLKEVSEDSKNNIENAENIILENGCLDFVSSFKKVGSANNCTLSCVTQKVDMSDFHCSRQCELYCCSDWDATN